MTSDGPIGAYLATLHARVSAVRGGEVATYIPALAKANPNLLGIAIATVDGKVYTVGDADSAFTIQSVSKPFLYGLGLERFGREKMLTHVGVEPTGDAFNATVLDEANNRPFNPMVNAGAIAVAGLVEGDTYPARRARMLDLFNRFAGRELSIDEEVFTSERDTGDRNRMIAALMRSKNMIGENVEEILDLYFSQCSVLVTCRDLALMAATLANGGAHPHSGARVLKAECVQDVLTVMNSCGMYNWAGAWSYEIGVPAKSGVAGSIIAVIPGQIGIAAFSPPLDSYGNSVRAIAACREIASEFGLHVFRAGPNSGGVIRGEMRGDIVRSKRRRTALERAALVEKGADLAVIEAQGALFFGSAERLVRRAGELAKEARYIILDLRRVLTADAAACALLMSLHDEIAERGGELVFAHPDPARLGEAFAAGVAQRRKAAPRLLFADRDDAMEWFENRLLSDETAPGRLNFSFAKIDLFTGLMPADLKLLESMARTFVYEPGQFIIREGEIGRLFFVIAQGHASVRLGVGGERTVRIASLGPGAVTGDMALLDGGVRSADVVADERVVCYGFSVDELEEQAPATLMRQLYANMARDMAERLRGANGHIRALEN